MENTELHALLSHPDAFIRAMADHALAARRPVPAGMPDNGIPSYRIVDGIVERLAKLQARCIAASDQYFLD